MLSAQGLGEVVCDVYFGRGHYVGNEEVSSLQDEVVLEDTIIFYFGCRDEMDV